MWCFKKKCVEHGKLNVKIPELIFAQPHTTSHKYNINNIIINIIIFYIYIHSINNIIYIL